MPGVSPTKAAERLGLVGGGVVGFGEVVGLLGRAAAVIHRGDDEGLREFELWRVGGRKVVVLSGGDGRKAYMVSLKMWKRMK